MSAANLAGHVDRIQPVAVNAMRLWLAAGLLLLVPGTAAAVVAMDAKTWLLCTVAAFIGPFLGRICIMYAVSYIPASHATLVNLAGPLFAFLFDYILFGSTPSGRDLVGGVVILLGVCVPIAELAGTALVASKRSRGSGRAGFIGGSARRKREPGDLDAVDPGLD